MSSFQADIFSEVNNCVRDLRSGNKNFGARKYK